MSVMFEAQTMCCAAWSNPLSSFSKMALAAHPHYYYLKYYRLQNYLKYIKLHRVPMIKPGNVKTYLNNDHIMEI